MNCPSCQGALNAGSERCPSCGAMVAPLTLGNLAPDPSRLTPPARARELSRELPGARKREKPAPPPAWKDEVRERVRQRRKKLQPEAELPLFPEPAAPAALEAPVEREMLAEPAFQALPETASEEPMQAAPLADAASEFAAEPEAPPEETQAEEVPEPVIELALGLPRPVTPDLQLRRFEFTPPPEADVSEEEEQGREEEEAWQEAEDPQGFAPPASVERPAQFGERVQAGAVDALILAGLFAVVVYFASRAAKTSVAGLEVAWPWLAGYLGFLGLAYAAWFTGMRGQTPGKMMFGLLVLTQAGERPGWVPAIARAATGAVGIALAGLGMLPLFFDPARRAFHDRLLRTRVVKV